MTTQEYDDHFLKVMSSIASFAPYDNPDMLHYTELNKARHDRWMKKGVLLPETISTLMSITEPQHWVLITEPWCGDAAHSVPFILKMAEQSSMIDLEIRLRDSEGSEIDRYLTNGGKAIPILVVRNETSEDLFRWGARPKEAQALRDELISKGADFETQKIALQKWYNQDQGVSIQEEIVQLLKQV